MRAQLAPGEWLAAEFQVFSQWNEDELIQHLVRHFPSLWRVARLVQR